MSNLRAKAAALRTRLMSRDASPAGQVLYHRKADGGYQPIDLTGKCRVGGINNIRQPQADGLVVIKSERDYLIPVCHLCDGKYEPKAGDKITEQIGDHCEEFVVIETLGEPCWRWSDPGHTTYRVHTKPRLPGPPSN